MGQIAQVRVEARAEEVRVQPEQDLEGGMRLARCALLALRRRRLPALRESSSISRSMGPVPSATSRQCTHSSRSTEFGRDGVTGQALPRERPHWRIEAAVGAARSGTVIGWTRTDLRADTVVMTVRTGPAS